MQRITSLAQAIGRDVYLFLRKVIVAIIAIGTGRAVMVASSLPWGPLNVETAFSDPQTFRDMFSPDGFDRTNDAYLMAVRFGWVDLQIVRVLGVGAVKAFFDIPDGLAANSLLATALYYGTGGNGISIVIAAADDAVANHFNMTVSKTDPATGLNTTELYSNVDSTQVQDDATHFYWATLIAKSKLLGSLVRQAGVRPANATYTLGSGSNGAALVASDYTGTQGNHDKGIAVLELDQDVNFIFLDEVPAGIQAAVNAGLEAHVVYMNDQRIGIAQGQAGETATTAKSNAAAITSDHMLYAWPKANVFDDNGNLVSISLSGPTAAWATLLAPHLSLAIKRADLTKTLSSIKGLDQTVNKATKADLEKHGVLAWEKNKKGTFSPYANTMTDGVTDVFVTRMADFIGESIAQRMEDNKGAPNDTETNNDQRSIADAFMQELVANQKRDHIFFPYVKAWQMNDFAVDNSEASVDAGDAFLVGQVQLASDLKRSFLSLTVGTAGITVTPG